MRESRDQTTIRTLLAIIVSLLALLNFLVALGLFLQFGDRLVAMLSSGLPLLPLAVLGTAALVVVGFCIGFLRALIRSQRLEVDKNT